MLFSTPTQFAVLVLLLVAGWLFGLASHPGGRKWRERYATERDAHAAARKDADANAAARRDVDARIVTADNRVAELEHENARLKAAAAVDPTPVYRDADLPIPVRADRPVMRQPAATTARPAYPVEERRGWFDWGDRGRPIR